MELVPIGVVHSPYRDKSEAPFQGVFLKKPQNWKFTQSMLKASKI